MKKYKRKGLSFILIFALFVCLVPTWQTSFFAAEDAVGMCVTEDAVSQNEEMSVDESDIEHGMGYIDIGHDAGRINTTVAYSDLPLLQESSIPTSYSSVTEGYVTSVKDQGSWGTCWAFAACAAMESYVLRHGYESDASQVNFSEYALTYLTYKDDSLSSETGDYTEADSSDMYKLFKNGGCDEYAFKILNKGLGIYSESSDTYYQNSLNSNSFYEFDALAHDVEYVLTGQRYISMQDMNQVKAAIMENGAVASSYYSDEKYYADNDVYGIYNYNYETSSTNHGIAIVGWDDTISKENFKITVGDDEYKPQNDGAWLVKNSWGTGSEYTGYIWISYEDLSILSADAVVYQVAPKAEYQNIYQHDGSTAYLAYLQVPSVASVYTITGAKEQEIHSVSFAICSTDSEYTISVYKNTPGYNLNKGTLLTQQSGTTSYEGYYTVDLDSPITVYEGDVISVVIEFAEDEYVIVGLDDYAIMSEQYSNGECHALSTVYSSGEAGQSYSRQRIETYWYPFQDVISEDTESTEDIEINNICMKMYTNNVFDISEVPDQTYTGVEITPALTITDGEYVLIQGTDYTLAYSNNTNAGTAKITITYIGSYASREADEVEFTILPKTCNELSVLLEIDSYTYDGSAKKPFVTVQNGQVELTENTDYTVSYTDNVDAGTATVLVTFKGNYTGSISKDFTILPYTITEATIDDILDQEYTASAISPTLKVSIDMGTLVEGVDYTVEYSNNVNVGTASAKVTFKGNFSGDSITKNFDIIQKDASGLTIDAISNQKYTGSAITPNITVKNGSVVLTKDVDYTVVYSNNVEIGTATATISFSGNYKGSRVVNFSIVDPVPEQITSSNVSVNENATAISKLSVGTTAQELIDSLNEKEFVVIYNGNETVVGSSLIGTGMTACIVDGNTIVKQYSIVVTGDTNGDGKINITDMIAVKAAVLKKSNLSGVYEQAGDVNGDGKINITDFIKTKAHILKKDTIIGVTAQ